MSEADIERLVIRTATAADIGALAELRSEFTFEDSSPSQPLRPDYEDVFDKIVLSGIESRRWTVWVAEAADEIVGHVYVGLIERIPRPIRENTSIGYVTNVYVRPDARRKGVGSLLMDRVQVWAQQEDVELLFVWPSDESVAFYKRLGFRSGRDPLVWEPHAEGAPRP